MDANYFGFLSRSFGHALDQSRIEGTPLRQSVRKQRTIILQDSLNQEIQVDESVTVKNTGLLAEYCLQDLQAAEQAESSTIRSLYPVVGNMKFGYRMGAMCG